MSAQPTPRQIDKTRWPRLSPLLDELLELPPEQREPRLQALAATHADDPELLLDLRELLRREQAMAEVDFLAAPAPLGPLPGAQQPGQTLGVYTLERVLGQGGMGSVWLASRTDGRYQGQVAIKFLTSGLLGQGDAGRFAREGQILARLAHPNIARLIDAGVSPDTQQPYLVLEYVQGLPIDQHCREQGLGLRQRVSLMLDVLAAVAHAHHRLILHRDLKPSNILVTPTGEPKLLDFGIAKLLEGEGGEQASATPATELTQRAGNAYTPHYAAPEQVQGGEVTMATDVYALGVLLYQLLSGAHPADTHTGQHGDTPLERLRALVEVEPKRLSELMRQRAAQRAAERDDDGAAAEATQLQRQARELRGDLDTIVAKALKKTPSQRYPQADALADDLRRWLNHEPISARPDTAAYRIAKFVRRHPWGTGATSAAVLALAALTTLSVAQAHRAERAEQLALQRSAQADDLLGYMLGEFADKLRPLGRLELLAGVGGKALAHLGATPDATASPASLLQRAKALTVLGEVSVAKRELAAATEPLQAARRVLGEQAPAAADAALAKDWRIAQGAAAFWLGHVHYLQREFAPAQAAWEDYRRYSQAVLDGAPDDQDAQLELSYALNSLGTLMLDTQQLAGAAAHFEQSLALKAKVMQARPKDIGLRADWADSLFWLASALYSQGRFKEIDTNLRQGLDEVLRARAMAPNDMEWVKQEATARFSLARSAAIRGDNKVAASELEKGLALMRPLLVQQPDNRTWWLFNLSMQVLKANIAQPGAMRSVEEMQGALVQLDRWNDGRPINRAIGLTEYAEATRALARHLIAVGRTDEVRLRLEALSRRLQERLDLTNPDRTISRQWVRTQIALARLPSQSPDAASAFCKAAWSRLSLFDSQLRVDYDITKLWVETLICLGRSVEAEPLQAWLRSRDSGSD